MNRIILLFILAHLTFFNVYANTDIPEILIKPTNEEYTRLSSGLAGANITIIDGSELISSKKFIKMVP